MIGEDAKLTPKQEKALVALLRAGEVREAAKQAGVTEVTLHRWLKLDVFKAAYRAGRRELVEVAVSGLQADAQAARRVLREIAEDAGAPATARVTAAKAIIDVSVQGVTMTDLMSRLENIEAALEGK